MPQGSFDSQFMIPAKPGPIQLIGAWHALQGASDADWTDPRPYVGLAAGGNDGVIFEYPSPNNARFTIPGGIEIDVRVGSYKTWLVCCEANDPLLGDCVTLVGA